MARRCCAGQRPTTESWSWKDKPGGARTATPGFSPLGDALHVVPGHFSPAMIRLMIRFGTEMPYATASALLAEACGLTVSHDTIRRYTHQAGSLWRQLELELAGALEAADHHPFAAPAVIPERAPLRPDAPAQVSVDGAMISVLHGEWAEVRTLVVGRISPGPTGPKADDLSYISRLTNADAFGPSVLTELARRGVLDHPAPVIAVTDGAPWIQDLLDHQCPDAVRILDFMHAGEYLASAAKATFGPGTAETSEWFATQRAALRNGQSDTVLTALRALPASSERDTADRYLTPRRHMLQYDHDRGQGWPLGSGAVESANKLVVEARLKRSGMHWQRDRADVMVGLRALDASHRWSQVWPRIVAAWRAKPAAQHQPPPSEPPSVPPPVVLHEPAPPAAQRPKTIVNGRPTADHPWKRFRPH